MRTVLRIPYTGRNSAITGYFPTNCMNDGKSPLIFRPSVQNSIYAMDTSQAVLFQTREDARNSRNGYSTVLSLPLHFPQTQLSFGHPQTHISYKCAQPRKKSLQFSKIKLFPSNEGLGSFWKSLRPQTIQSRSCSVRGNGTTSASPSMGHPPRPE